MGVRAVDSRLRGNDGKEGAGMTVEKCAGMTNYLRGRGFLPRMVVRGRLRTSPSTPLRCAQDERG